MKNMKKLIIKDMIEIYIAMSIICHKYVNNTKNISIQNYEVIYSYPLI